MLSKFESVKRETKSKSSNQQQQKSTNYWTTQLRRTQKYHLNGYYSHHERWIQPILPHRASSFITLTRDNEAQNRQTLHRHRTSKCKRKTTWYNWSGRWCMLCKPDTILTGDSCRTRTGLVSLAVPGSDPQGSLGQGSPGQGRWRNATRWKFSCWKPLIHGLTWPNYNHTPSSDTTKKIPQSAIERDIKWNWTEQEQHAR